MSGQKYDAGSQVAVKKRKTKAQIEVERCTEELKELLQKPGNRYFLWRLLSYCKVFQSVSVPDPHMMAIHSGMRDAGLFLLGEILQADASAYAKMQVEAVDREAKGATDA